MYIDVNTRLIGARRDPRYALECYICWVDSDSVSWS